MKTKDKTSLVERIGHKIPDPVILFIFLFLITFITSIIIGGLQFSTVAPDGGVITFEIKNMATTENIRWIFDNAILTNWLAFGNGVLGTILIVMFGVGVAEHSGLLTVLIKKVGMKINEKYLPVALVLLGIMSSTASDAGYLILIPLAGMLYAGLNKNPLIGMAAAFAGVSAGFSANLIPASPSDIIIGVNAQAFAQAAGVPFESALGTPLTPATMTFFFTFTSAIVLTLVGAFVTVKFIKPKLEQGTYVIPEDMDLSDFQVKPEENKALKWALFGLVFAGVIATLLALGPLASFVNEAGRTVSPFMNNIILIISFLFFVPGVFYGYAVNKYSKSVDVIRGMSQQVGTMGYIIVLTFFSYNFLALLTYSNLGTYITYLGATALVNAGLDQAPILLIIGFMITTAIINIFIGGLTSKWMLLGPIFIPMLYQVNPDMTPDLVAAAYRVADSSTNIITPLMAYAGVVLVFMRKYKPEMSIGDMIIMMFPYSMAFFITWTALLISFFVFQIPLGF